MARIVKPKQPPTRWHNGSVPLEQLTRDEQLAHALVVEYRDLTPSVERIMNADLAVEQRVVALTAFRDSLGRIGDPNRDPRIAIANAAAG